MTKFSIVVDNSVITDFFVAGGRHDMATVLADFILDMQIRVVVPAHCLLEIRSTMTRLAKEARSRRQAVAFESRFSGTSDLKLYYAQLSERDMFSYDFDYIKGGDLSYAILARKLNVPLITEDKKLLRVACEGGVSAFTISSFVAKSIVGGFFVNGFDSAFPELDLQRN